MSFDKLTFSLPEILSLLGLAQSIYVLVYIVFRAGELKRAIIPFTYFFVLGLGFFLDLSERFLTEGVVYYDVIQWAAWSFGPPLSVLLIVQIARIYRLPRIFNAWIVFLIPVSIAFSLMIAGIDVDCEEAMKCRVFYDALKISGFVSGSLALGSIWFRRNILNNVYKEKTGQDRYWLILTLIIVNLFLLIGVFLELTGAFTEEQDVIIRTLLGIALVYLAGTSLFRIYPQALVLVDRVASKVPSSLSPAELEVAKKIENLIDLDKVYHDPRYSRAQLSQELDMSEAVVSKIVNHYFIKSFPQLLNERRVEDAKRLLTDTDASIRIVSSEVGFNSVSSFNRVFRDITGVTPSSYRQTTQKRQH